MSFNSNYKAFINQISETNCQAPCLASIFGQTLYYVLVSNSNFYDFKISSELQPFTPYVNFPNSNYSYKNSQCLISLTRGGRLELSPWSVIDPQFSSKYSWLYVCYILCRNYFWVAPLSNRKKFKPIFQPKHNLFTLNYTSINSNNIIQFPNYVFNPVISLILGPMTEFNLTKFFRTTKKSLKWPYHGFVWRFLNNFFTNPRTKKYKNIVAEGFMGPNEIAYLSEKKQRILRKTVFKNRRTWFCKFKRNKNYRRRFVLSKIVPPKENSANKKRSNNNRNYHKQFIFVFWKQIFKLYLKLQDKLQLKAILIKRLNRFKRKCRSLSGKFSQIQFSQPREKEKYLLLMLKIIQLNRRINNLCAKKSDSLRSGHNWKNLFKYYKRYKFGLQIRFFRSIIHVSNFLNFIDRYFNRLFKFSDSIKVLGNSHRKFTKFIKYWTKLRCTRRYQKSIKLVRTTKNRNQRYKRKFVYKIKPWGTRALTIYKNFNLIRTRIGIQSIYALSRIAYFRSTVIELKSSVIESISYSILVFNYHNWFRKYIHSIFPTLCSLNRNYWFLLITNFKFLKVRNGAVIEFDYSNNINRSIPVITKQGYCSILCNSNTFPLFTFASSDFYFPSKIIKFQRFTTRFGIRPVRRMGMYTFIFPIGTKIPSLTL